MINRDFLDQNIELAFDNGEFIPFYQPQYDNYTGLIIGAEALARWNKEGYGLISPGSFIPYLEEEHLITKLDLSMFEQVCIFQKKCMDMNIHMVPISVNVSMEDVSKEGFIDNLDSIREKYGVDVKNLRIEITESIASTGKEFALSIVDRFHKLGYIVELDDFGSGYSSLNILKDVDYDILKLDMAFLTDDMKGRGGTIVSSVVRMAKWLKMPVIAEGVETKAQADFMKSVGCEYIQGYIYAKPMDEIEFMKLLSSSEVGVATAALTLKETVNPISFWSEKSLDTFVFNNYVGGAAVFLYNTKGEIEILRVNKKYIKEIGMNMTEEDVIKSDLWDTMDDKAQTIYENTLRRAIKTEEEQECETWRQIRSSCCGDERLAIRSNIILIGKSEDEFIFYETIRNITREKQLFNEGISYENKFKTVLEQANIYYWEYTIATKEMRPCFRCMRDLGLPPLVRNYPEPAIEQGIFPPDYADMYREWHKKLQEGVPSLEAVIPLTVGRVPFHVRYTTEFDELNRPVKAYGSATLVTDKEMEQFMEKNAQK